MSSSGDAYVFGVYSNGYLYRGYVSSDGAVVPVINLSPEYVSTLVGDGTMDSPYQNA